MDKQKHKTVSKKKKIVALPLIAIRSRLTRLLLQPASVVTKDIAIGAGGFGFDSQAGQMNTCRRRLATVAMFLRSCVAQALNHGNGPRHSLHALA